MIDLIFPAQIEETPKFCQMAEKLGYSALYIVCDANNKKKIKEFQKDSRVKLNFLPKNIIADCRDRKEEIRILIERSGIKIVYNLECNREMDYIHHRNSGLNHILCDIAQKKNKMIAFNFGTVLNSYGSTRAILCGRMKQNVKLCRKYQVNMIFASFASKPMEMRDAKDMLAFGQFIGMTPGEAKKALNLAVN